MYLIAQDQDGTQTAATLNDIRSYSKALTDAENHLRRHPETVALYLWTDNGSNVVRTYVRATKPPYRVAEVLFGLHEWPKPPIMYPAAHMDGVPPPSSFGVWTACGGDQQVNLTQRAYDVELAAADQKGYNRGFKVGIAHRNRERAAQLRQQAGALDRVASYVDAHRGPVEVRPPLYPYQEAGLDHYRAFFADYGELEARAVAHYGGGRNLGKSAALGAPYGLPGSVRAGVRGWSAEESKRPTFTVDLGHNRR